MNITPTSHPCIFVSHDEQDAHFPGEVESSLNRLRSGPSGNNLLDELRNFESRNKRLTIERYNGDDPGAQPCLTEKQQKKYGRDRVNDPSVTNTLITKSRNFLGIKKNGKGTSVTVKWSPNLGFKTDEEGMAHA
ncbi:M91 family zinc metallopeptidase [Xanthomonas populi]